MKYYQIWIVFIFFTFCACDFFEVIDFKEPNKYEGCCGVAAVEDTIGQSVISIPNAITPNADGINDAFSVHSTEVLQITSLQIKEQNDILAIDRSNIPLSRGWTMVWTPRNASNIVIQGLYNYTMILEDKRGEQKTITGQFCAFICGTDKSETIPKSECHFSTQVSEAGFFDLDLPSQDDCD